jgi:hypothetical protein
MTTSTFSSSSSSRRDDRKARPRRALVLLGTTLALTLGAVPSARGGARILCDVIDIGAAPSLPWGSGKGWNLPTSDYSATRLVPDTLGLLTPTTPIPVRMETLRRATIYARAFSEARVGRELAWRLLARAVDAEARGKPDALAWFDAGYFAESLEHWDQEWVRDVDGYAYVQRAAALRGADPEIELGAMIIAGESPQRPGRHYQHLQASARKNPQLARSLAAVFTRYR